MIDIDQILVALATERPIFHSEADFQHALAWKIHECCPRCRVRLEYHASGIRQRQHIDIWVEDSDEKHAIELKYCTRALKVTSAGERFDVASHAHNRRRYNFIKDIERLEKVVSKDDRIIGHVIFLTNDSAYWTTPKSASTITIDAAFRMHEGRTLTGTLSKAGPGSIRGKEAPIMLRGSYELHWREYGRPVAPGICGQFRFLHLEIAAEH